MGADNNRTNWSGTEVLVYVNDVEIVSVSGLVNQSNACYGHYNNAINVYLKKGDKLSVKKKTRNSKVGMQNDAYIKIKKCKIEKFCYF